MNTQRKAEIADQRTNYYWERVRKYGEQYKDFKWPLTELVLSLVYTHDIFMSNFHRVLFEFDLSMSAMNILIILKYDEGEGFTQQALSDLLLVSRANVTKVIDGLEKRGLVIRNSSKEDRRTRVIKLTEAGKDLASRFMPKQNEYTARITNKLTKNEISLLNKLLTKFRKNIVESGKVK